MDNPILVKRPDYCPYCDSERSVEIYDVKGKPLMYTLALDSIEKGREKGFVRTFSFLSCKRCNISTSLPLYTDKQLPYIGLSNIGYKLFMTHHSLHGGLK